MIMKKNVFFTFKLEIMLCLSALTWGFSNLRFFLIIATYNQSKKNLKRKM